MPRTFSRGEKIDAAKIEEFLNYVPPADFPELRRRMRLTFCDELPLEEQNIIEPLLDFIDRFRAVTAHWDEWHVADAPHLRFWMDETVRDLEIFTSNVQAAFRTDPPPEV